MADNGLSVKKDDDPVTKSLRAALYAAGVDCDEDAVKTMATALEEDLNPSLPAKVWEVLIELQHFLQEPRPSEDGGWAPVDEKELDAFKKMLDKIIDAKWAPDYKGSSPISTVLVDRHKWRFPAVGALPVEYTPQALEEAIFNVTTTASDLERVAKMMRIEANLATRDLEGEVEDDD